MCALARCSIRKAVTCLSILETTTTLRQLRRVDEEFEESYMRKEG